MSRLRGWWRGAGWHTLHSETLRGVLSLVAGSAATVVLTLVVEQVRGSGFEVTELLFAGLAVYLATYVWLTLQAFSRTTWSSVEGWARRRTRAHWVTRLVTASEPGPGVASGVSVVALLVAVLWLPSQQGGGAFSTGQQLLVTAVLVAASWLTVAVTYSVAYLLADVRSGGTTLHFPGESPRRFTDYLYFALAVSTTFGPTDVQVLRTDMRRLVATHAVTAFAFNTVVLGAVVSMLVALR